MEAHEEHKMCYNVLAITETSATKNEAARLGKSSRFTYMGKAAAGAAALVLGLIVAILPVQPLAEVVSNYTCCDGD